MAAHDVLAVLEWRLRRARAEAVRVAEIEAAARGAAAVDRAVREHKRRQQEGNSPAYVELVPELVRDDVRRRLEIEEAA